MSADQAIDAIQTSALLVTAGAQIYIMFLLRNELRSFGVSLKRVLDGQAEVMITLERAWKRIDKIEIKLGLQEPPPSASA